MVATIWGFSLLGSGDLFWVTHIGLQTISVATSNNVSVLVELRLVELSCHAEMVQC